MRNIEEFYFLGESVETNIGMVNFLTMKEYPEYYEHLIIMSYDKYRIAYTLAEFDKTLKIENIIADINKVDLYDLYIEMQEISIAYNQVFAKVFNDDSSLFKINRDNFNDVRNLILRMNHIKENKANPNPEIEKWQNMSRRAKSSGDTITLTDMASSIVGFNGLTYKDISEMTVFQFYMTFYRINQIKGYDTSTLFATVSSEKIDIKSWCSHIDPYEEEETSISKDQFNKQAKGLFDQ